jgi:hypothetical protein
VNDELKAVIRETMDTHTEGCEDCPGREDCTILWLYEHPDIDDAEVLARVGADLPAQFT